MRPTSRRIASRRSHSIEVVALARERDHLALEQLDLVDDHRERIVDLVREPDRDLAERRELILAQDLAQILGEADRAVLLAALVVEQRPGDRDGDALARLREELGLEGLDDARAAVSRRAHRAHHALGLVEIGVELRDVDAEDLRRRVAEDARRAVVVVDDLAVAIGRHDDVGGARDQALEPSPASATWPLECSARPGRSRSPGHFP